MYKLDRSQRAKLSRAIKEFNRTMESLGVSNLRYSYQTLKDSISSKKQYEQYVKRLKRINKPSQQKILTSKNGTQYLKWEEQELKRLEKAANKKRKRLRIEAGKLRNILFIPTDDEVYYRDRNYNLQLLQSRKVLENWFKSENKILDPMYEVQRKEQLRTNILASLNKWPEMPAIKKLKKFINEANADILGFVVADPRYDVSIHNNYAALYSASEEEIESEAINLYERWVRNVAQMQENIDIMEGRK